MYKALKSFRGQFQEFVEGEVYPLSDDLATQYLERGLVEKLKKKVEPLKEEKPKKSTK